MGMTVFLRYPKCVKSWLWSGGLIFGISVGIGLVRLEESTGSVSEELEPELVSYYTAACSIRYV